MIGLPNDFLAFTENSKGGGVMQVVFIDESIVIRYLDTSYQ